MVESPERKEAKKNFFGNFCNSFVSGICAEDFFMENNPIKNDATRAKIIERYVKCGVCMVTKKIAKSNLKIASDKTTSDKEKNNNLPERNPLFTACKNPMNQTRPNIINGKLSCE